ncbi:MAG: CBS domain-containing protein [Bryobacteraceae bacterium]|nr:CBS domain-containing protein [Bryobacteraceae bacterium]
MERRVRDVMQTHVVAIGPEDTLRTALRRMNEHHVRQLPVIENGYLTGILTDRDIRLHVVYLEDRLESADSFNSALDTLVDGIMTREVNVLHPEDSLDDAAALFLHQKFGGAPVVLGSIADGNAQVVGILTYIDLLEELRRLLKG